MHAPPLQSLQYVDFQGLIAIFGKFMACFAIIAIGKQAINFQIIEGTEVLFTETWRRCHCTTGTEMMINYLREFQWKLMCVHQYHHEFFGLYLIPVGEEGNEKISHMGFLQMVHEKRNHIETAISSSKCAVRIIQLHHWPLILGTHVISVLFAYSRSYTIKHYQWRYYTPSTPPSPQPWFVHPKSKFSLNDKMVCCNYLAAGAPLWWWVDQYFCSDLDWLINELTEWA